MSDDNTTPPDGDDAIARRKARRNAQKYEWQRKARAANPEKRAADAEYQRKRREAQPEKLAAEYQRWREKNRDYWREYRVKNPELLRARRAEWARNNPDHIRAANHRRLARMRAAEGHFTPADTAEIRERQQDRCVACGCDLCGGGDLDHNIPLSRGGSNWPSNLQWLCVRCNRSKATRTMDEFLIAREGRRD